MNFVQRYMNSGESIAVNRVDDQGCTSLHIAVFLGWEAVMELLINGPTKWRAKHRGQNFCDVEKVRRVNEQHRPSPATDPHSLNAHTHACMIPGCTHARTHARTYSRTHARVQATPDGFTPLMIAAKQGHGHAVEILLEAGANVVAVMPVVNSSPIYFLAQLGHIIAFQSLFHLCVP